MPNFKSPSDKPEYGAVAAAAAPRPGRQSAVHPLFLQAFRKEVIIMMRKLHNVLIFDARPVLKDRTQFNAQLLEQRREDIFLAMHQMGLLR
ncbi:hypothetical protein QFZ61_000728 [Arthrobacter sp. B3I4]|nr:hypothetical protein [Arthrobacter sp. B3I4]